MKKGKKKIIIIIAVVIVALIVIGSMTGGDEPTGESQVSENQGVESAAPSNTSNLGAYEVVIDSCRLAESYDGKPIVIVKYIYTNNDDVSTSFSTALENSVYQDGIGLNECYVADDSANYSMDNQIKEIKKGATLDVEVAYELNDTTTDIEVEVSEWLSFSDRKVTKIFSIK